MTSYSTTRQVWKQGYAGYQMDVFHKTLEQYKLRRGQKIVFIHGKGDGVLRQRILWELQTKYKRFNHQDASFKQYGYGATMVTIK
ncbi:MAG: Smr/MutS family protein [Butyricimonas faecihominis]